MGKGSLPMLFLSIWVVFFGLLSVYQFDGPRHFVMNALMRRDTGSTYATMPATSQYTATAFQGITHSIVPTYAYATGTPITVPVAAPPPPPPPVVPVTTYQYKILENTDTCTLNKLGAQGWHTTQFGGTLILNTYGYDEDCKKGGLRDNIDWVVIEKVTSPPTQ